MLIPSFQFGGMEHPGAVYYNASGLLLDESATQNQMLGRASLISHETAHMWFGDLVTMTWFNDVWMKEVFANFMAAKIVNPSFPDVNHELRFLLQHYPSAYDVDRTDGANPIRQELANLNEAGSLYGAIIYQKAPIVMRQLELLIGADAFRDGLREYLKAHTVRQRDVARSGARCSTRGRRRIWRRGAARGSRSRAGPRSRTELEVAERRASTGWRFRQSDPRGRDLVWPRTARVVVADSSAGVDAVSTSRSRRVNRRARRRAACRAPRGCCPTGGGLGYGYFDLDPTTLECLDGRGCRRSPIR